MLNPGLMTANETIVTVHVEDLPSYVYCDIENCGEKHFLQLNRDAQGKWSAGYVEYETYMACLFINDAETMDEAATRLSYSLERHHYSEDTSDQQR